MGTEYIKYGEVLYAPSIRINDDWLKLSALYYDKVNRIIPNGLGEEHSEIAKEFINESNLINDLEPTHQESIEKDFLNFAVYNLAKRDKRKDLNDVLGEELDGWTVGIHSGKTTSGLINRLKKLGLVVEGKDGWNDFDAMTGTMYMGFLAKRMAESRKLPIVTSSPIFHNAIDLLNEKHLDNSFKLAAMVIDGYSPKDISSITPKKIIEFREKYGAEREAFYHQINELTKDVSEVESEDALRNILKHRKKLIDTAISDIQKAGSGIDLPFVKGLFSAITSFGQGDSVGAISSSLDTVGVAIDSTKKNKALSYVLALNEQLDKESLASQLLHRKIVL